MSIETAALLSLVLVCLCAAAVLFGATGHGTIAVVLSAAVIVVGVAGLGVRAAEASEIEPEPALSCPDNWYYAERVNNGIRVTTRYARTDFAIRYVWDGVQTAATYGRVTFENENATCQRATWLLPDRGKLRLSLVEWWPDTSQPACDCRVWIHG